MPSINWRTFVVFFDDVHIDYLLVIGRHQRNGDNRYGKECQQKPEHTPPPHSSVTTTHHIQLDHLWDNDDKLFDPILCHNWSPKNVYVWWSVPSVWKYTTNETFSTRPSFNFLFTTLENDSNSYFKFSLL